MSSQPTRQPLRAALATPESAAAKVVAAPEVISGRDRDLAAAAPYLADWEAVRRELPETPETRVTPESPETSETPEISALRQAAIRRFAALGFPTTRQEEWRYTNLAPLARAAFRRADGLLDPADRLGPGAVARGTFDAAATLVFVDGRFAPALSTRAGRGGR